MSYDPEDAARDAAIRYETTRIIAERAEDEYLSSIGADPIVRPPIPPLRLPTAHIAEALLDAAEAERLAAINELLDSDTEAAESRRVAETISRLEAEIAALRQPPSQVESSGGIVHDEGTSNPTASPPDSSGTFGDLLGDFLPTERNQIELEYGSMQIITKADRVRLNASEKSKIHSSFIKGTMSKFKASSTIVGLDEIATIENVMSFSQLRIELQKHITGITAHPVFLILRFDEAGTLIDPDSPLGTPVNILCANVMPPIEDVEKSTMFHHKRGSPFNHENLVWSYEAIRNSCDKDLQGIIDAKMLKYRSFERFGPLYYFELMQQMTTVDSKAVRAITQELASLKVVDQEGQSIAKTAKLIRSTIIWLETVNMLPPDIDAMVYDVLETCTVPDFQLFLKTLSTNATLNRVHLTAIDLLDKAEEHYRTLILSKRWDSAGHQGSSFQAQRTTTGNSNNTTSNSGRRDHAPPASIMPTWSRTAPLEGEQHQREYESKTFKWCGVCGRWFFGDRGHLTHEHVPGYVVSNRSTTPTVRSTPTMPIPSSNLAVVDVSTAPPPSSGAPPASTVTRNYFNGGL